MCEYQADPMSNFAYQVKMTFVTANTCGGLIFRDATSYFAQYYEFYICTDGSYHLAMLSPLFSGLREGFTTFNTGVGQANLVAVVANGTNLAIYINGQKINSVTDSSFSGGKIGVVALTLSNPDSSTGEVAFNDAKIWTF